MSADAVDQAHRQQAQREHALLALACLDLTSLNDNDTPASIDALALQAQGPAGLPAALCVWPRFVAQARAAVPAAVGVAAVVNFPGGGESLDAVVAQARGIVADGGQEVDLVLPWRAVLEGRTDEARTLVEAVREATDGAVLKLIIESGELREPAAIEAACRIGLDAGVDFLKTSTGKTPVGATPEAAEVMLRCIAAHPAGERVGFKASGGVRTVADAAVYIALTQRYLGEAALGPQRLRFGASSLLADIQSVLGFGPAASSGQY